MLYGKGIEAAVEDELKIRFRPPTTEEIDEVRDILSRMAPILGHEPLEPEVPPQGFLVRRLTKLQRNVVNGLLSDRYAEDNFLGQKNLRKMQIEERGEPMVPLPLALENKAVASFSTRPIHSACGEVWGGKQRVHWLREGVMEKVRRIFMALNDVGYQAHVEDCWRHEDVQQGLLWRRVFDLARQNRLWSWGKVKMVAMSLTAALPRYAEHQGGSAIDWTLHYLDKRRKPPPLGNDYAESGASSSIRFPYLTPDQWKTRQIVMLAAEMGGMRVLDTEDWHSSYGGVGMSQKSKQPMQKAIYGPIRNFDRQTGKVEPYEARDLNKMYLSDEEIMILVNLARDKGDTKKFRYSQKEAISILRDVRARSREDEY